MAKLNKIYTKNADWQKLIVLGTNRNKRHRHGEFLVEGVRNINGAIANNWEIASVIYCPQSLKSDWAYKVIADAKADVLHELSPELMAELSGKEDTSELMMTVKMRHAKTLPAPTDHAPLYLLYDRPSNRGNLGTVIRSCDGFGADGLIICGHGVDPYDPETIVSTMGSFFSFPFMRAEDANGVDAVIADLKSQYPDLRIIGTTSHAQTPIYALNLKSPTLIILGNETDGMSAHLTEICTTLTTIPMSPKSSASSFNAACAATTMLYEVTRQRKGIFLEKNSP
jgi:rRNA methylases